MKILDSVCASPRVNNEDFVLTADNFALVLDGSTNLGMYKNRPDAAWFVRAFSSAFAESFDGSDCKSAALFAMRKARSEYISLCGVDPVGETALPSASFSVMFEASGMLNITLLGDCSAIVYPKNGKPYSICQGGVAKFDNEVITRIKKISESQGISVSQAAIEPEILEMLRSNRALMNTEGGYWILSFCEEALDHMLTASVPLCDISHAALFTDGFSRAQNLLLEGIPSKSLAQIYGDIFDEEEADSDFAVVPRFKLHDDAACVLVEI